MNTCAHRACRTTAPCRYAGQPPAEYVRPFRTSQRVGAWFVVDDLDRIVAGAFDSSTAAWAWIDRNGGAG